MGRSTVPPRQPETAEEWLRMVRRLEARAFRLVRDSLGVRSPKGEVYDQLRAAIPRDQLMIALAQTARTFYFIPWCFHPFRRDLETALARLQAEGPAAQTTEQETWLRGQLEGLR